VRASEKPFAAIFDLDKTITRHATYTPFVLSVARLKPMKFIHAVPIILAAIAYTMGIVTRARLKEIMLRAVLLGATREEVAQLSDAYADECINGNLQAGAIEAISKHRENGDLMVLATASFDIYANVLGRRLGFDHTISTRVAWSPNDEISGEIDGENCRGVEKLRAIERALPDLKDRYQISAYSDHHSDIPLLRWADSGYAVNPNRRLAASATDEGFTILDWRAGRRATDL